MVNMCSGQENMKAVKCLSKILLDWHINFSLTKSHPGQCFIQHFPKKNLLPDAEHKEVQFTAAVDIDGAESDCSWILLMVRVKIFQELWNFRWVSIAGHSSGALDMVPLQEVTQECSKHAFTVKNPFWNFFQCGKFLMTSGTFQ